MADDVATSESIACAGHFPKYVFVLSLENRSFDHLFGRSNLSGKSAEKPSQTITVDGVLKPDGSINSDYNNNYDGRTWGVPPADALFTMPGDPKHEYEHILCQTNGPQACKDLYKAFGVVLPKSASDDALPVPQQSSPAISGATYARGAPNNSGFIHAWVKSFTENKKHADDPLSGTPNNIDEVMRCFDTAKQLPVLYGLAQSFVLCDKFFSSLPGPTGPNRFFMMAGSSAGYDRSPFSGELIGMQANGHLQAQKGNIFKLLEEHKVKWQVFGDDNFPMAAVCEGVSLATCARVHTSLISGITTARSLEFHLKSSRSAFPYNFVWIEPDYDIASSLGGKRNSLYATGNSMHPCSDVRKAEQLIHDVYGWIRNNKEVWPNCMLIITWDEHGGFYDHVPPPVGTAPGDGNAAGYNQWGFGFDRLGIRVPALIISPLIEAGLIDHRTYDHTSILKTVIKLYNSGAFTNGTPPSEKMGFLTNRVKASLDLLPLFTRTSARTDAPGSAATPLTPGQYQPDGSDSPLEQARLAAQPVSGNMPIFLACGMNLHKDADPAFNPQAEMAGIKTMGEAVAYLRRASAAIDRARTASPDPSLVA